MNSQNSYKISLKFKIVIAVLAIFFSSHGLSLAVGSSNEISKFGDWSVVGPSGGDVRVVAVDPKDKNRLYISTLDGQIHTSSDGGITWKLLANLNRPQLVLDQMIVDVRDSKTIYASGHRHNRPGGFFKTSDGGLNWKEAKELNQQAIHSMAQSSFDPNMILVGTLNGIWMSKNAGDDWKKIESETMPPNVGSLAIDPRNADTIYAGTWWRAYKTSIKGNPQEARHI